MHEGALWRRAICGIHNLGRKLIHISAKKTLSGVWFNIVQVTVELGSMGINFSSFFGIEVKSGSSTLLWLDDWTGDGALASRFPDLTSLDKRKSCLIADQIVNNEFSWAWKRTPSSVRELVDLHAVQGILSRLSLSSGGDEWRFKLSSDGVFYVNILWAHIDSVWKIRLFGSISPL